MKNLKKIILFLGAISLIGWGSYVKQKSKATEITKESKNSERAISSKGNESTSSEKKSSERATSSKSQNSENTANEKKQPERATSSKSQEDSGNKKVENKEVKSEPKAEKKQPERASSSRN